MIGMFALINAAFAALNYAFYAASGSPLSLGAAILSTFAVLLLIAAGLSEGRCE